jgi:His-Xaa-Ser repeat protein HxsA
MPNWNDYLRRIFGIAGIGSTTVAAGAGGALGATPPDSSVEPIAAPPVTPLIFERPYATSRPQQYAGHSSHASHASHASHSSHYSGSGGSDYGSTESDDSIVSPTASPPSASPATTPAQNKLVMVLRVQAKLHDMGYYQGTIDGSLNEATKLALKRYQLVKGLSPTAKLDDATLLSLGITY